MDSSISDTETSTYTLSYQAEDGDLITIITTFTINSEKSIQPKSC